MKYSDKSDVVPEAYDLCPILSLEQGTGSSCQLEHLSSKAVRFCCHFWHRVSKIICVDVTWKPWQLQQLLYCKLQSNKSLTPNYNHFTLTALGQSFARAEVLVQLTVGSEMRCVHTNTSSCST